jgi:hypothetical protein
MKIVGASKVSGEKFTTFYCDAQSSKNLDLCKIRRKFKSKIKDEKTILRVAFWTTCQGRPTYKNIEKIVGITFVDIESQKIKCLALTKDISNYLIELETLFHSPTK